LETIGGKHYKITLKTLNYNNLHIKDNLLIKITSIVPFKRDKRATAKRTIFSP
jgi:hypothetical protein